MAKAGPSAAEKRNHRNLDQETRDESYALVLKTLQSAEWSIEHRISVCKMFLEPELYPEFDEKFIVNYMLTLATVYYEKISDWKVRDYDLDPLGLKENRNALVSEAVKMLEAGLSNVKDSDHSQAWYSALREASKNGVQGDHTRDSQELTVELIDDIYGAVEYGKVEDFKRLMGLIPLELWAFDTMEYWDATPLHWAALHGQEEMVSFIEEKLEFVDNSTKLAIVNAMDRRGFTPLHMAVLYTRPKHTAKAH